MSHICLQRLFHLILRTNARGHTFHSARNQNDDGGLLKILFGCAHRRHQKVLTQSGSGCWRWGLLIAHIKATERERNMGWGVRRQRSGPVTVGE